MTDIIQKFFSPTAQSIKEFFERPGVGYYIPLYQREYSWGKDNIDQLMEDLIQGTQMLISDEDVIRFMGTVILVKENNPDGNIKPQEPRAIPARIDNIIDGQQRISTLALLACLLHRRFQEAKADIPKVGWFQELHDQINIRQENLLDIFSFDLRLGSPKRKPIVIRGSSDNWTVKGDEDINYKSEVTSFIARTIKAIENNSIYPVLSASSLVGQNLTLINEWLDKVVYAHDTSKLASRHQDKDDFPAAWALIGPMSRLDPRHFGWQELSDIIENRTSPLKKEENGIFMVVQLFALCHFLLERCCFTSITPISEENAFDMFQSLNATGTPLTALETFKPLVYNMAQEEGGYQGSLYQKYFDLVEDLFEKRPKFLEKTKLTNEFLNTLALAYDGKGLPHHFSRQRRWLKIQYEKCNDKTKREDFIRRMSELAQYWEDIIDFNPKLLTSLPGIQSLPDINRSEATLCVLYLNDANHARANTVLSRFYALMKRGVSGYDAEFANACRIVAAFYTLWRASYSNTGLDAVYERILQNSLSWNQGNTNLTSSFLKNELKKTLNEKGIGTKNDWMRRAVNELRYDLARPVCKFALFVSAHDTVSDSTELGLMQKGMPNTYPYLEPIKWRSDDFKTIEHIAPQKPDSSSTWDSEIYQNGDEQRIGNLTLLPAEINAKAGNKRWAQKWIYYQHLAETKPERINDLKKEAVIRGIALSEQTLIILQKAGHNHHIQPIVEVGVDGSWNRDLITRRTERICSLLWDKVYSWLE